MKTYKITIETPEGDVFTMECKAKHLPRNTDDIITFVLDLAKRDKELPF